MTRRRYTKTSRRHLKAHDAGNDRHHKGMAYEQKRARLEQQHQTERSTRKKKPDPLTPTPGVLTL